MNQSATSTKTVSGMSVLVNFVRSLTDLSRALRHRGEIRHLAEFDDRMLKDIGLTRSDVSCALSEPLLRNPSWVLVRSAERHSRGERSDRSSRPVRPVVPIVRQVKSCA
ncbi:DUF1127 domain-containing protein [Microvirga sp. CF3062]|uniref:DUF1127 domain-containing protein n=1 Tax=Microvirga sp. CF3062 TaxID=3110182 RepID=UPI002E79068E|nr:DUF1127 domain-containing protein [Microvirga sp. CF3062]MEE1654605.1 DUF1127 domain-containing protein [Microvirga sp. CF3062]